MPRFFTDARTFSVLPTHAAYRPLVSASIALDYRLAGGLDPVWFHVSTLAWYIVQLTLMYLLFVRILDLTRPGPANGAITLFAVSWYALHPANTETINYVIQRGELYSTLGVIAGLVLYSRWPAARKLGLYLLPVIAGALAKPPALVFPILLFAYVVLFEAGPAVEQASVSESRPGPGVSRLNLSAPNLRRAAGASLPAILVCAAMAVIEAVMTASSFAAGATTSIHYWLTQPIVALHYFKLFFLPTELTADTDRQLVTSLFSEASVIGIAFLGVLLFTVRRTLRAPHLRPVAFGLLWFLVALLPTSLFPLAEVENDHRMFFPFVGLTLAVTLFVADIVERKLSLMAGSRARRPTAIACAILLLAACAYATYARNRVWRSEESLWRDVTEKSPRNGRGWMNYGLTQMSKGDTMAAYSHFQRAAELTPNYSTLEINLGVAAGALQRDAEAEQHFQRAIALDPQSSRSYSFYGRWLQAKSRTPEAISVLNKSAQLNPADLEPRYQLMRIYSQQAAWPDLQGVTDEVLRLVPGDSDALRFSVLARDSIVRVASTERLATAQPTPENFLSLSLAYYQERRYDECIRAAKDAIRLRPAYAEAYNNIAAAYQSMGRWDEAIVAAEEAIRLKPDFQLARNNLTYALSHRPLGAPRHKKP